MTDTPPPQAVDYSGHPRDDILRAIARSLPALRDAVAELPAVCRYHNDRLDPYQPSYGREACCDTGRPAMRRRKAEEALRALTAQLDTGHA